MPVFKKHKLAVAISLSIPLILGGCGDDDIDPDVIETPDAYVFQSKSLAADSSVNYREATTRLLLIKELEHLIESDYLQEIGETLGKSAALNLLNSIYEGGTFTGTASLVSSNIYDKTDSNNVTPIRALELENNLSLIQQTYLDVEPNINLKNIIPGKAGTLPLKTEDNKNIFIGWYFKDTSPSIYSKHLIDIWLEAIADIASDGKRETKTSSINNYKELLVQFLYGSIAYAQVSNTLLNDAITLPNNTEDIQTDLTTIQHQWDMAFGYFGSPVNISNTNLSKLRGENYLDTNQDSFIDIYSEMTSNYINKSTGLDDDSFYNETQFTNNIVHNFLYGRAVIDASENADPEKLQTLTDSLQNSQFKILEQWEKSIAAQMIRHINRIGVAAPLWETYDANEKSYVTNWSALKALTLIVQFSPHSRFSLEELHQISQDIGYEPYKRYALYDYLEKIYDLRQQLIQKFSFSEADAESWN